ncbi:MAG: phosphatidylserine decarboxylase family protein [Candidatus Alcyoniella australis]|nr:phosphatidylserine decarboxylase family protein [Candidatus Alcyoniella australis]
MNNEPKSLKGNIGIFAREGLPFIVITGVLFLIAIGYHLPLWVKLLVGLPFLFSLQFFRNPERVPPDEPLAVISPADGKVCQQAYVEDSPLGGPAKKISVFMNVFNVHVNRSPYDGVVETIQYTPGRFLVAERDEASEENERNLVVIRTPEGCRVAWVQVAGFVARRVVCYLHEGDRTHTGRRMGLIRFGSRLDVFLPPESEVNVQVGQKVKAGITVLGRLKCPEE